MAGWVGKQFSALHGGVSGHRAPKTRVGLLSTGRCTCPPPAARRPPPGVKTPEDLAKTNSWGYKYVPGEQKRPQPGKNWTFPRGMYVRGSVAAGRRARRIPCVDRVVGWGLTANVQQFCTATGSTKTARSRPPPPSLCHLHMIACQFIWGVCVGLLGEAHGCQCVCPRSASPLRRL